MVKLPILIAKTVRRKVYDALNFEQMSDKFMMLALNFVFLMAYFNLEVVFVNTLLLRVSDGDIRMVLIYRSFTFAFSAMGMFLVSMLSGKINSVAAIRIAGVLYTLTFLVLFAGMNHLDLLMYIVAFFSGVGNGFYFLGHNMLLTHYTTAQNRGLGMAIMAVIQGITALMMPLVSGLVIGAAPGMIGYRVMFGAAIVAVLVQMSFMRKLSPVSAAPKKNNLRLAFSLFRQRLTLRLMVATEFSRGLREGVFMFFLNIVLFEIVDSESLVGVNAFLAGLASIVSAWLYGKISTPRNRAMLTGIAASAVMLFCLLLVFSLAPYTVMLFSVVNAFLVVIILNCVNNTSFDIIGYDEVSRSAMSGLLFFREAAVQLGRICGIVVVSRFPATLQSYVRAMLALTATLYLVTILLRVLRKEMDALQRQATGDGRN